MRWVGSNDPVVAAPSTTAGMMLRLPDGGAGRRKTGWECDAVAACRSVGTLDNASVLGPSFNLQHMHGFQNTQLEREALEPIG